MAKTLYEQVSGLSKKAAIPGLHALAAGLAGHVGVNALGRSAHQSTNLAEMLAHKGFQHGATGSRMSHMAQRSMNALLGPEVGTQYHAARKAGEKLYAMPPAERSEALRLIAGGKGHAQSLGMSDKAVAALGEVPILPAIQKAVGHDIAGTAPKLTSKGPVGALYGRAVNALTSIGARPFPTTTQKVVGEAVGAAPMGALLAADPGGALAHMGWNTTREAIGRSNIGKKVVKGMMSKGLAGEMPSKGMETFTDLAVSPAFLDAQRFGKAVHDSGAVGPIRNVLDAGGMVLPEAAKVTSGTPLGSKLTGMQSVVEKLRGILPKSSPVPA